MLFNPPEKREFLATREARTGADERALGQPKTNAAAETVQPNSTNLGILFIP